LNEHFAFHQGSQTIKLRLGTRGSKLALAQARTVSRQLQSQGHEVEICPIKTSGDRGEREVLGAFVREIQHSLLRDEVDIALHCLKDLPTIPIEGLALSAYLEREDPSDALISYGPDLKNLPSGAVVGTGSLRRTSQLLSQRRDLSFRPLMGNIDTRLQKVVSSEYNAIVLAIAGLHRLGLTESWGKFDYRHLTVHRLTYAEMLPAPGQAALVLETRDGDIDTIESVRQLHHPITKHCVVAEREFLGTFGTGCSLPVAALCVLEGELLELTGQVTRPDGSTHLRATLRCKVDASAGIGIQLANELIEKGAAEFCEGIIRAEPGTEK
jgi:hydroxymethylbilane synthase